jgi:putative Holliday junction resolvase
MPRRVVAVDLGTRRMGVAVTDGLGLTAQPHATLARHGGRRDLDAIAAVVRELDAERVVLGLPLGPSGEVGRAARAAQAFAERLRAVLAVPVELIDESFTTVEAEEVLIAADLSRARRKQVIDRAAAAIILRRWMEARAQDSRGGRPLAPEPEPSGPPPDSAGPAREREPT